MKNLLLWVLTLGLIFVNTMSTSAQAQEATINKIRFIATYVAMNEGVQFSDVEQLDQWIEENSTFGNRAEWHQNLYGENETLATKEGFGSRFKNRELYLEGQRGNLEDEATILLPFEGVFPLLDTKGVVDMRLTCPVNLPVSVRFVISYLTSLGIILDTIDTEKLNCWIEENLTEKLNETQGNSARKTFKSFRR